MCKQATTIRAVYSYIGYLGRGILRWTPYHRIPLICLILLMSPNITSYFIDESNTKDLTLHHFRSSYKSLTNFLCRKCAEKCMHCATGPGAIQTVCPRLAWICGPPQNTGKQCPLTAMLRTPWFTCVLYPAWTVWCNASRLLIVLKLWTKCKRYYRCESRFTTHSRPVFNHVYINHCCISYLTYILLVICKYSPNDAWYK